MDRVEKARNYILNRMYSELNPVLYYHNVPHVLDVLSAAESIGTAENISNTDMELLKVAALFHDCGFIVDADNHEKLGCDIARKALPEFAFTDREIDVICGLILATRVPQSPSGLLEKIICDADLDYLGRDDFYSIGNKIYREFLERNIVANEQEWNELQVKFLSVHNYFTNTSIRLRAAKKNDHLKQVQQILLDSK